MATNSQSVVPLKPEIETVKVENEQKPNDLEAGDNTIDIKPSPTAEPDPRPISEKGATLSSSVINMMNTIIGAGVLSIPSTISKAGLLGSFLILAISLYLSLEGANMLSMASVYTSADSYGGVGTRLNNKTVGLIGDIAMIVFDFGISIAYFIILFDQAADLVVLWGNVSLETMSTWKPWLSLIIAMLVGFPILCIPSIDALRFTSTASVICICLFVVISTGKGINQLIQGGLSYKWFPDTIPGLVSAISVFFTSMCCHVNIPKMTSELKFPSSSKFSNKVSKMSRVNTVAFLSCGTIYFVVGAFGYLAYGDQIAANLLTNFTNDKVGYLNIVKLAYAFVVLFSYPALAFAALVTLDKLCFKQPRPAHRRYLEAFFWTLLSAIVAIVFPILDKVFGVTGSMCGILLNFAIPAFYFVLIAKIERAKKASSKGSVFSATKGRYYFAWVLFYIGVVAAVVFTAIQLKDLISSLSTPTTTVAPTVAPTMAPSLVPTVAPSIAPSVAAAVKSVVRAIIH